MARQLKIWLLKTGTYESFCYIVATSQKQAVDLLQEAGQNWGLSAFRAYAMSPSPEKYNYIIDRGEGVYFVKDEQ